MALRSAASASEALDAAIDFRICNWSGEPAAAGREDMLLGRAGSIAAGRIRFEELRMIEVGKRDVVAHDDHPHPDIGQIEEPLREVHGQAHATVRGRTAGQHAGVQRNAGPGDALHERHVAVLIEVGVVDLLLLHDAEDAGRRLVAGRPVETGDCWSIRPSVVDRDALSHRARPPPAAVRRRGGTAPCRRDPRWGRAYRIPCTDRIACTASSRRMSHTGCRICSIGRSPSG